MHARSYRGTSLIRRYSPTVGSWEGGVSYERGTPVATAFAEGTFSRVLQGARGGAQKADPDRRSIVCGTGGSVGVG